MTGLQTDPRPLITALWDLPLSEISVHSLTTHPALLEFASEDAMRGSVRSLVEVKADDIHFSMTTIQVVVSL